MSLIKIIRQQTGLSQSYLAMYLRVSRSMVNMAENGDRQLPEAAFRKISGLLVDLEKAKGKAGFLPGIEDDEQLVEEKNNTVKELEHKIKECDYKAELLRRKLKKKEKGYQEAAGLLQVIKRMYPEKDSPAAADIPWFEMCNDEVYPKFYKNSMICQQLLQVEIDVLKAKKEIYERFLGTLIKERI